MFSWTNPSTDSARGPEKKKKRARKDSGVCEGGGGRDSYRGGEDKERDGERGAQARREFKRWAAVGVEDEAGAAPTANTSQPPSKSARNTRHTTHNTLHTTHKMPSEKHLPLRHLARKLYHIDLRCGPGGTLITSDAAVSPEQRRGPLLRVRRFSPCTHPRPRWPKEEPKPSHRERNTCTRT